ncbi:hypothetical protein [uncultured Methylobacterium sp.]|jgi:hypothetical protein|uniref:hypothetical protein n=1 Tax=uncultured Methylobacterium sp. TaxID=157278 RepID=UPI002615D3C6|nr:hypothetical protein [uncultured Methylobacterium sp.]
MKGQVYGNGLRYRDFLIYEDVLPVGSKRAVYVGEPLNADPDEPILELSSKSVDRLMAGIDEIHAALGTADSLGGGAVPIPWWLQAYFDAGVSGRINLDLDKDAIFPAERVLETVGASERVTNFASISPTRKDNFVNDEEAFNVKDWAELDTRNKYAAEQKILTAGITSISVGGGALFVVAAATGAPILGPVAAVIVGAGALGHVALQVWKLVK